LGAVHKWRQKIKLFSPNLYTALLTPMISFINDSIEPVHKWRHEKKRDFRPLSPCHNFFYTKVFLWKYYIASDPLPPKHWTSFIIDPLGVIYLWRPQFRGEGGSEILWHFFVNFCMKILWQGGFQKPHFMMDVISERLLITML